MLTGLHWPEQGLQFEHILRKALSVRVQVPPQRPRRAHIRTGRTPESEIDTPGIQGFQRAELLRDHQRRVVRQHDAAGADPNAARAAGNMADHDRRRGARDAGDVVMLGEPVALITEALGVTCEVE